MDKNLPDLYTEEVIWAYGHGSDAEGWQGPYPTRASATAAAIEAEATHVCECRWISPGKVAAQAIDMDDLLERMDETDHICGTFDEPIFEITIPERREAARAELEALLSDWAEKHIRGEQSRFMCVVDPIKVAEPVA